MFENKEIRILIVCSGNAGYISPFVLEQSDSLKSKGIIVEIFPIKGRGFLGYLSNYSKLIKKIKIFNPNLIHAHYGLSGMLAVLQRRVPVITTFHGSDINASRVNLAISKIVNRRSAYSIFAGSKLIIKLNPRKRFVIIPCGINIDLFFQMDKTEAKKKLGFDVNKRYVLFSSAFTYKVKNYSLALSSVKLLENVEIIEMAGYSREETNLVMNACDALLVTSFNESGPLVVKEALACGCPIVSTDVGDVIEVIGETKGCYITGYSANEVADNLKKVFENNERIQGRERIIKLCLTNEKISDRIINLYKNVLNSEI